jgi:diguanylate cyclase (GGDEF)-like protein
MKQILRLYILPVIVFVILFLFFSYLLVSQKGLEINELENRSLLQTTLLAEKITSKLNVYEMLLEMLTYRLANADFTNEEDLDELNSFIKKQKIIYGEIALISVFDGEFEAVVHDSDLIKENQFAENLKESHLKKQLKFAISLSNQARDRYMVLSRTVFDSQNNIKGVVALSVTSRRFFEHLVLTSVAGMESSFLFDNEYKIYAVWNNPLNKEKLIDEKSELISENELFYSVIKDEQNRISMHGGARLLIHKGHLLILLSAKEYPVYVGFSVNVPKAIKIFNRSFLFNLVVIFGLLLVAALSNYRAVKNILEKERIQKEMVEKLSTEVEERTAKLEQLSVKDDLTGLANRRKLNQELENAIIMHNSIGITFSIMIIDLDNFKSVNDTLGHVIGDQVLIKAAQILNNIVGPKGIVARWGGDELMVLLSERNVVQSYNIAKEYKKIMEKTKHVNEIVCTVSIGVAEHSNQETSIQLIRRVDSLLYKAKTEGKNRVVS